MTDIGALYGGNLFGRTKMAPVVSPNKTWEGTIIGTSLAILVITGMGYGISVQNGTTFWLPGPHRYGHLCAVTLIMSSIGHVGDLCESAMKRDAGIKDSGVTYTGTLAACSI